MVSSNVSSRNLSYFCCPHSFFSQFRLISIEKIWTKQVGPRHTDRAVIITKLPATKLCQHTWNFPDALPVAPIRELKEGTGIRDDFDFKNNNKKKPCLLFLLWFTYKVDELCCNAGIRWDAPNTPCPFLDRFPAPLDKPRQLVCFIHHNPTSRFFCRWRKKSVFIFYFWSVLWVRYQQLYYEMNM